MDWLKNFGRKKQGSKPVPVPGLLQIQAQDELEDPEMKELLDSFMRTCWPANHGDFTLGVDTHALKELRGPYLEKAKAAILESLAKSPGINPIIAASAIEMNEAIPIMILWVQHIRFLEDKNQSPAAYRRLAYALYNYTKDEATDR